MSTRYNGRVGDYRNSNLQIPYKLLNKQITWSWSYLSSSIIGENRYYLPVSRPTLLNYSIFDSPIPTCQIWKGLRGWEKVTFRFLCQGHYEFGFGLCLIVDNGHISHVRLREFPWSCHYLFSIISSEGITREFLIHFLHALKWKVAPLRRIYIVFPKGFLHTYARTYVRVRILAWERRLKSIFETQSFHLHPPSTKEREHSMSFYWQAHLLSTTTLVLSISSLESEMTLRFWDLTSFNEQLVPLPHIIIFKGYID
jgi:hypothetical protein